MKTISIAGAFTHKFISFLLKTKLHKKYNLIFYDGVNNCAWNGGRVNRNIYIKQYDIELYNKLGCQIAFTFTNSMINLKDKKGLELLEYLNNSSLKYNIKNEIILCNEDLRIFLKDNYNFNLKFSITGHDLDAYPNKNLQIKYIEYYKNLENKYDIIVPKMEHVFQEWFYKNVNTVQYEIMLNDTCSPNCQFYKQHFEAIAKLNNVFKDEQSAYEFNYELSRTTEECWLPDFNPNIEQNACKTGMDLNKKDIKKLEELNFFRYKISGRENTTEQIIKEIGAFNVK